MGILLAGSDMPKETQKRYSGLPFPHELKCFLFGIRKSSVCMVSSLMSPRLL